MSVCIIFSALYLLRPICSRHFTKLTTTIIPCDTTITSASLDFDVATTQRPPGKYRPLSGCTRPHLYSCDYQISQKIPSGRRPLFTDSQLRPCISRQPWSAEHVLTTVDWTLSVWCFPISSPAGHGRCHFPSLFPQFHLYPPP